MADLDSEKKGFLSLSHKDQIAFLVDIRTKRREGIIASARKKSTKAKKPKKTPKRDVDLIQSLSLEDATALLAQLQGES